MDIPGNVSILTFILVLLMIIHKYVYPWYMKKFRNRRNNNRVADTMYKNPTGLTLESVAKALEQHEKYDGERVQEILRALENFRKTLARHGERLSGLETRLKEH